MKINLAFLRLIQFNYFAFAAFICLIYVSWTVDIQAFRRSSWIYLNIWDYVNFHFPFVSGLLIVASMDGNLSDRTGIKYLNSRAISRSQPLCFYIVIASVFGGLFFLAAIPLKNQVAYRAEKKKLEANELYRSDMRLSSNAVHINGHMARKLWESGYEVKNFLYEDWLREPERRLRTKKWLAELKIEEKETHMDAIDTRLSLLYEKWLKEFKEYKEWKKNGGPFPYDAFDWGWGASAMLHFPSIWISCISAFLLFVSGALLRLSWTYGAPGSVGGVLRFILKPRNAVPLGFLSLILLTSSESVGFFGNGHRPYPHSLDMATLYINFHWIVPVFAVVLAFISWALIRQWNLADIVDEAF